MKLINYILFIAALLLFATACETTELDLLDNPNAITPDKASINDLYNNIQLTFQSIYTNSEYVPGAAARMYNAGAFTYQAFTTPEDFNFLWNAAYAGLFPDVDALLVIAEDKGFAIHAGSAKIMKAYTMMLLVDLLGNVPNTEAIKGTDVISPKADGGDQVYAAAVSLLDEAIAQLQGTTAPTPASDIFYNGKASSWITAAKTFKLKAALNQRLIKKAEATATINSIISGGDFIDTPAEDFQFNYSAQRTNPNSRHRYYNNHYEIGDGDYLSTYFMWLLLADKVSVGGQPIVDPRIRYYFYRKIEKADEQDETTYSCHFSSLPDQSAQPNHWKSIDPRLPYCIVMSGNGYSGRDHLNGEGIPPDGPTRTSYGLYPGAGQFDDDSYQDTRKNGVTGGLGKGILPIMMSSFVDFMRAEAALTLGTTDNARTLLESGIRKSVAKVVSFESLVPTTMSRNVKLRDGSEGTVKDLYGTSQEDIDKYVADILAIYDAAAGNANAQLNIIIKEFYIAAWGNGFEAYNMYRRTGFPSNIQPGLEPEVGPFPRSFFLPSDHVSRNATATQKLLTDRVFWDDGSTKLY